MTITNGSMVFGNVCSRREAGGGFGVQGTAVVLVANRSGVYNNTAGFAGGGMAIGQSSRVVITNGSFVANNTCIGTGQGRFANGGAGLVLAEDAVVVLEGGSRIEGNAAVNTSGAGVLVSGTAHLVVKGGVEFVNNLVSPGFVGADIAVFAHARLSISPGVLSQGRPLTKCSKSVFLGKLPCEVGEHLAAGICQCCPAYTYNFAGNGTACEQCPANALCPGGDVVQPLPGY